MEKLYTKDDLQKAFESGEADAIKGEFGGTPQGFDKWYEEFRLNKNRIHTCHDCKFFTECRYVGDICNYFIEKN